MNNRTKQEACHDKHNAIKEAEKADLVADSMDVRAKLISQMNRGEKTLAEIQAELAAIKRNAKKNGKLTRSQVWRKS